jgi:DNA-binding response OmpR family regulator
MKILVVEDDHKLATAIRQGLEHESYVVDIVFNGIDAYDYAKVTKYDLIILDRMLPGMDGIAVSKKLRAESVHIPIIMLTAKSQVEDRVSGLDAGADDYLTKPFAFVELLARIRALIRRPQHTSGNLLQVADLTLDLNTLEVKLGEKIIELSGKEYALLEFMMRHKNKIVTKNQIMDQVWNYDAEVVPNFVEVYINHLRNKIDTKDRPYPLIKTVRGFGYKIYER